MLSLRKRATKIIRNSKNGHRFIYFIDGKIRTFATRIDDINSQVAALFGALNALSGAGTISQKALLAAMLALIPLSAHALDSTALPTGYQSVSGNHQFQQSPGMLNVTTSATKSIVNYDTFNIGRDARVNFNLPSSGSSILNRVVGGNMSEIYGTMASNGRVFLVNPAGIFFGNGANVSVNGLVASTLSISDAKFLAGQYQFSRTAGSTPGHIQVESGANINVLNGGSASFIGSSFANHGNISAPGGAIQIGVGDRVTLGDDLIGITVNEPLKDTLNRVAILNTGNLNAAQVKLIASTVKQDVLDVIVNNSGRISANKIVDGAGGSIILVAENGIVNNSGIIDASGIQGGQVVLQGEAAQNAGQILAIGSQAQGGQIHVLGNQSVALTDHALINASGFNGGGTVLIGGDYLGGNSLIQNALYTYVGQNVWIKADALQHGNGGKVIVWGTEGTGYYGNISAQGGLLSGNGGFVETSGRNYLDMLGNVNANARSINGQAGTWLLDPRNVNITNVFPSDAIAFPFLTYTPIFNNSRVSAFSISTALSLGTDVVVHTGFSGNQPGNISVDSDITKIGNNNASLSLYAANDINVNSNITANNGTLDLILRADHDVRLFSDPVHNGAGSITLNGNIITNGGYVDMYGVGITLNKNINTGSGSILGHATGSSILQTGGNIQTNSLNFTTANGHIQQLGGSVLANTVTLNATGGNILYNGGTVTGNNLNATTTSNDKTITVNNADFTNVTLKSNQGDIIYKDKDGVSVNVDAGNANATITASATGLTASNSNTTEQDLILTGNNKAKQLTLTANEGQITQSGGTIAGTDIIATTTANGKAITINNADFTNAALKSNQGNIQYSDKDGVKVTVNAGNADASIHTFASGITANNGITETDLALTGDNQANKLTLNAKEGNISQLDGTAAGTDLIATTTTSGNTITVNNADFKTTDLKTNYGAINYSDTDGVSVHFDVGTSAASQVNIMAGTGGSANNGNTESGIQLTGGNQAGTVNVTAKSGDITLATSSDALNAHTANLTAETGNITQTGGTLSAVNLTLKAAQNITQSGASSLMNAATLNAEATNGKIEQTGGTIQATDVTLNAKNGIINQAGAGVIKGTNLMALTNNTTGKSITINNADFTNATLKSKNASITYQDRDGVTVTVQAGSGTANIYADTNGTANNNITESGLQLAGINQAGELNLQTKTSDISQGAGSTISGNNLKVATNTGNITLDNDDANNFNTLTVNTQQGLASYRDIDSIEVKAANLNTDNNGSKGSLKIQTNGSGNITQSGKINGVDTLSVITDQGNVSLTNSQNDANHLVALSNQGSVNYRDINDINVQSANLNLDNNASLGNLSLETGFTGNITQTGSIIGVNTLKLRTNLGNAILDNPMNTVNNLDTGSNYGSTVFTNSKGFVLTGANMNLNGLLWKGDLSLTATTGQITQSAAINASELKINGNAILNHSGNNVDVFSAFSASADGNSDVSFTDKNGFNLGRSNIGNGSLTLSSLSGELNQDYYFPLLSTILRNRNITENGGIKAGILNLNLGNGVNANLTDSGNAINNFSLLGNRSCIKLVNNADLNLLNVQDFSGTLNTTLLNGHNLTQSDAVNLEGLKVTMNNGGDFTLNHSGNDVSYFSANATGSNTANTQGSFSDSKDGFTLAASNMKDGDLALKARNGGTIDQGSVSCSTGDCGLSAGIVKADELKITLLGGGDVNLTRSNLVNSFSANAKYNSANSQVFFSNNQSLNLADSNLRNGDLALSVNGNLNQDRVSGNITQLGTLKADELLLVMLNNHDATLNNSNSINSLSANASGLQEGQTSQIRFTNNQNLNLGLSNLLGRGDLEITLLNGSSLDQTHQGSSRSIIQTGGVFSNELSLRLWNGGSADLTTQSNRVNVFAANTHSDSKPPIQGGEVPLRRLLVEESSEGSPIDLSANTVVRFHNMQDLNIAQSNVGKGALYISAVGNIDNRNLEGDNRNITSNNSTIHGGIIDLKTFENGSINVYNDIAASDSISLTTANNTGSIYVQTPANVEAKTGSVYINTNVLTLDGDVNGQLVQLWPWNLNLSMGIAGGSGGFQLSQGLIGHINRGSGIGLNTIMFGHQDYTGTINLGSLNLSRHTLTNVAFNAPRVFDATPNNDSRYNLIMANNRNVYFTAGADTVANWATAPGGLSYGNNNSRFADLDILTRGNGLIHVKLGDYTGIGNSFSVLTGGGNRAFINVADEETSGSLKNFGSALATRASSLILNQLKGTTVSLPGNPINNLPTLFGSIKPVPFIPNQSL